MARTSLKATRVELYGILAPAGVSAVAGATVLDHEPKAGDLQGALAVTVASAGMTPNDFLISLRVYSSVRTDAKKAQDDLDDTIHAVDLLLDTQTAAFGPSEWAVDYDPDIEAFVAVNSLRVGREDHAFLP
jgi:hypothetical protein